MVRRSLVVCLVCCFCARVNTADLSSVRSFPAALLGVFCRANHRGFRFYPGGRRDIVKFDVLVTTYNVFSSDVLDLSCIKWQAVIVDEGHRIRNVKSKLLFALQQLTTDYRLLLTGTPLQNNTQELWSLLNFIEPEQFHDMHGFLSVFGDINDVEKVCGACLLKPCRHVCGGDLCIGVAAAQCFAGGEATGADWTVLAASVQGRRGEEHSAKGRNHH